MNETKKPLDFKWVEARERCSIKVVFEELRLGIRQDIETRNSHLAKREGLEQITIKLVEQPSVVRVFWDDGYGSFKDIFVQFSLKPQKIEVQTNEGLKYEAQIGLNENGDCKLKVGEKEYDPWQLRMKALEIFMFKEPE